MRTRSLFHMSRLAPVVLSVALVASFVPVTPAYAASILVNTGADNYANDGKCTLREAIDAANLNAPSGSAPGECAAGSPTGVDTISFHPGFAPYVITVGGGGTGLQQLPYIISPITILGLGAANTVIQAAAAPNTATWRLFQVTHLGTLTLDGVTVRHGRCNGSCTVLGDVFPNAGGGIYNRGTLTVANSIVTGNNASVSYSYGGAIFNDGTLTVTNSTLSGNTSSFEGGAIENRGTLTVVNSTLSGNSTSSNSSGGAISNGGTVTVVNSTISGNNAGYGGGIVNWESLTVVNSTISGNVATYYGGGIGNEHYVTIINSTIAGNSASREGGGLYSVRVTSITSVKNTIIAGNSVDNCYIDHAVSNGGNNLDSGSTCGFGSNAYSMSNTNPLLRSLTDNGGPTQTIELRPGSPAIDAGNPFICSSSPVSGKDQRGVIRPLGAGCDIGAFETSAQPGPDTVGVFRPSNGFLFLKNINLTGFADHALNYGLGGDYPVVGDWNGDGTDTIGVYRNGTFFLRNTNTPGFADIIVSFGQPGDQPVAGDWNGNSTDTIGVYRPSTGQFFLRNLNIPGAPDIAFTLGNPGDVAIAGDWNGDGVDTTGVFRPSNGFIFLKNTNNTGFADIALNYGLAGDKPVTGDWDFDGIDTIGVLRGNVFFLRNANTNGFADMSFALGNPGDMPIAGNWDGQP